MKRLLAAGAVVALSLSMVACSDSKLGSAPGDTTAASETEATDAGSSASTGGAVSGDSDSKFCSKARELEEEFNAVDKIGDAATPDDVEKAFDEAKGAIETLAKSAPDAIKSDIEYMLSKIDPLIDALSASDFDITKAAQDPEIVAIFNDTKMQTSSEKVDQYLQQVCGLSADGG